jgi:hypothetical protein
VNLTSYSKTTFLEGQEKNAASSLKTIPEDFTPAFSTKFYGTEKASEINLRRLRLEICWQENTQK